MSGTPPRDRFYLQHILDAIGWMLKWSDRNGRFHPYEGFERVRSFDRVVDEVEEDRTCIFFG